MRESEFMHHIHLKKGDVGRYVLLPGDPGRCELIARSFDNPVLMAYNREYKTYTGALLGEKVSVTSTGIGCPSTAIAVEELAMLGVDTFTAECSRKSFRVSWQFSLEPSGTKVPLCNTCQWNFRP